MKRGKEITLDINSNYKVKIGTVDNKNTKSIYINLSAWGKLNNEDDTINILDILVEVDYIFGYNPSPFSFGLADVNFDGVINILDVLGTQDIILNPTGRNSQNSDNTIVSENLSGNNYLVVTSQSANSNASTTIDIEMNNDDVVKGMEFDLVLPTGFTFNPADITATSRLTGFIVSSSEISTNTYKVLVFSLSSATISAGTGAILNLPVFIESTVSNGVYPLEFTNVVISDTSNTDISTVATTIGEITIGTLGIDDFTNSDNEFTLYPNPTSNRFYFKSNTSIDNVEIYDINGRTILITKYNENGIDIQHLSNGLYFVKSYINNNSKIFKLIKK